jgi:hypothetical protein
MSRRVFGKLGPAALHVAALGREIELALDRAFKFTRQTERSIDSQVGETPLHELGEILDEIKVGPHHLGDVGPPYLKRDHASPQDDRTMDLRNRRGGHWNLFDRRKHLRERPFVLLTQDRLDLGE